MNEVVFLGLSKSQWELINSFSNWLSAIGTICAVVVSLWLARRSLQPKARVSVGHRLVIDTYRPGEIPEIIQFTIVNTGEKPLRITGIGWQTGIFRWRRFAMQIADRTQGSQMPIEIGHGQEATWIVPLLPDPEGWMQSFPRKLLFPHWRWSCFTLRAVFSTSVGTHFKTRVEPNLGRKLRARCRELCNDA